tara:strand:+ start:94 stop:318 length:225 start_codon:yes stop_codon:yes gene_type:complete
MKPKPILVKDSAQQDTIITEQPPMYKKMSIETPMGKLESDSGNHFIDIISVIGVIAVLYIGKKFIDKKIEDFKL